MAGVSEAVLTDHLCEAIRDMTKVADRMNFVMSDAWYELGLDEICRLARQIEGRAALR